MYSNSYHNNKNISLPKLLNIWENSDYYIIWKIMIYDYEIYSDSFIKFLINIGVSTIIIKNIYFLPLSFINLYD